MNVEALLSHEFAQLDYSYTERDSALYALSVGFGHDPLDLRQLSYVYGESRKAAASMALVMANPGFWQQEEWTGIDWSSCLLGEQHLEVHLPLPASGRVVSQLRVTDIIDKGINFGALLCSERQLIDAATGDLLATLSMVTVCRGDGGFGGKSRSLPRPSPIPLRAPDMVCELPTMFQNALLFDLHGIVNPIHSWPPAAMAAGHSRPFLHGICIFGYAHHALIRELTAYQDEKISSLSARFEKVVYPGETLVTEIWLDGDDIRYQVRVQERDVVAVSGTAKLALNLKDI